MAVETFLSAWYPWEGQVGSKFGKSAFDWIPLMLVVLGYGYLTQRGYHLLQVLGSPILSHPGGGARKST